jgi:hypothetical protein
MVYLLWLKHRRDFKHLHSYASSLSLNEIQHAEQYKAPPVLYCRVKRGFKAAREDEIEARSGELLAISALASFEWVVVKPIGRLGGPGLMPIPYLGIRDAETGQIYNDQPKAIQGAS